MSFQGEELKKIGPPSIHLAIDYIPTIQEEDDAELDEITVHVVAPDHQESGLPVNSALRTKMTERQQYAACS